MCHSFSLNTNWLLLYIEQNHKEFLWDWSFALCYLLSLIIKIYTYLKLLIEFAADKKEKKWMNSRKQKGHSIPTDNPGKKNCFNEMKYVATRLEKKIVSYIHWFEDFPYWL